MMSELTCGGWEIYFHPQLFGQQYQELFDRVTSLKATLSPEEVCRLGFALAQPNLQIL
jgi:toxin YhaV